MAVILRLLLLIAVIALAYMWLRKKPLLGKENPPKPIEALQACPICANYVGAKPIKCGKQQCPY
ncbi:MAG: hypothetical protein AB7G80_08475 [Dongiaceae bacterium]